MAAVPSIGRADRAVPREADLTRVLYERYATQIFRHCLHQLGSREEAEDAVQSTFLNAFRGIKRGIVPQHDSAWLFKIAENVCLSRRRSTWRRGRVESPTDFDVVEELAPAPSRLADELLGLQDVLEQMPESQRRAILLREWQGLSYREIAEELELSQTAVETLIFRARRSLAKGLEAPPEPARKRRAVRGADLGNLLGALKSLLLGGGAAAAKVAAVVAVVGAGTVVATTPVKHHPVRAHHSAPVVARTPIAPQAPVVANVAAGRPRAVRHVPTPPAPKVPQSSVSVAPKPTIAEAPVTPTEPPASASTADAPVPSAPATSPPPTTHVSAPPPAAPTAPVTSAPPPPDPGAADGNGQDKGNGNGKGHGNGDSGQGNGNDQGQGQVQGNQDQGSATPPTDSGSGSGQSGDSGHGQGQDGGNGNGNGNGNGQGHGGGHGH